MSIATALKKLAPSVSNEIERLEMSASTLASSLTQAGMDQVVGMRQLQDAERKGDEKAANIAQGLIADADKKVAALRVRKAAVAAALAEAVAAQAVESKDSRVETLKAERKAAGADADSAQAACVVALLDFRRSFARYEVASSAERAATNALAREAGETFPVTVGTRSLGRIEAVAKAQAKTLKTITVQVPN